MDGFSERGAPGQMRGVIGAVGVVDLEADDLTAVDVEDQVQIEPSSLHGRGQARHIPAPTFARSGGDVRGWRACSARWPRAAPAIHLTVRAQHPMETGFAGDIDTLVGDRK